MMISFLFSALMSMMMDLMAGSHVMRVPACVLDGGEVGGEGVGVVRYL